MFVPVAFHPDDEAEGGEHHGQHHGEEEVMRLEFATMPMVIKVKNCVLILGLGVAAFIQFSTLDPRYLNTLMWGEQDELLPSAIQQQQLPELVPHSVKTLRSISAIFILVSLRVVAFPNCTRHANYLEAILSDLLFQMQCRFVVGFLTCFTPMPFERIEAAVVILSIALQTTTSTVL